MNKVTSTKTQIPYEYYDIPFCRPSKRRGEMENLGEVLAGDAITNSPYQVRTGRAGLAVGDEEEEQQQQQHRSPCWPCLCVMVLWGGGLLL